MGMQIEKEIGSSKKRLTKEQCPVLERYIRLDDMLGTSPSSLFSSSSFPSPSSFQFPFSSFLLILLLQHL
tara:strand:- start:870 stop:1079 length:210 start_codon:yes stop_codon:yes gene_type:complete